MSLLYAGIFLCLIAFVAFIFMFAERRRLERLTKNLGGRWTWAYALGSDRVPYLLIRLWPDANDAHTGQIMAAATQFRISGTPEGKVLFLGKEISGHLTIPYYQVCFVNVRQPITKAVN